MYYSLILTAQIISLAPVSSSALAGLSPQAGLFVQLGLSAQLPQGFGSPPNSPLRLRETPYTTHLVFPLLYLRTRPLYYSARAGIPNYAEGVITPSLIRPETSASPTWASAAVTGMFYIIHFVFLSLRPTLPDSADLPPGLYASIMGPSHNSHNRRTIQLLRALLASNRNLYTTMCQFRTTNTISSD